MSNHSSTYQTSFEKKILNKYSQDKKQNYLKAKIYENIHADFEDENNIEIGEIYAGIESLKPGQIKKIIADCFKLNYLNDFLSSSVHIVLQASFVRAQPVVSVPKLVLFAQQFVYFS